MSRRKPSKAAASKKPEDTDLKQQRLAASTPIGSPRVFLVTFYVVGVSLVLLGVAYLSMENVVYREQYDGPGTPNSQQACKIEVADDGRQCEVVIKVKKKMRPPVHVFYEIEGFHQNHRRYVKSLDWAQLNSREHLDRSEAKAGNCELLYANGSLILNPCGLIPNTLFNDVITLESFDMREKKIAWYSDIKEVYKQPEGFEWKRDASLSIDDACFEDRSFLSDVRCADETCRAYGINQDCMGYVCKGSYFDEFKCVQGERVVFRYDRVDKYAYPFKTFPQVISPIVGVNNEHFAVWLRSAGLPHFRKLYGRILTTVDEDTDLVFTIENNWDVHAVGGKKYLVVGSLSPANSGFEAEILGVAFVVVGCISLFFGLLFTAVHFFKPRKMGDKRFIPWLNKGDTAKTD